MWLSALLAGSSLHSRPLAHGQVRRSASSSTLRSPRTENAHTRQLYRTRLGFAFEEGGLGAGNVLHVVLSCARPCWRAFPPTLPLGFCSSPQGHNVLTIVCSSLPPGPLSFHLRGDINAPPLPTQHDASIPVLLGSSASYFPCSRHYSD